MKILFIGKGISNNGATLFAEKLKIDYDYINIDEKPSVNYDLIIKGPGISYDEEIIKYYTKLNKLIITDIEFIYNYLNKYYIGITGSNGKTTTTLLTNELVSKKYNSVACGNIGYSIGLAGVEEDVTHFICELSSFELKGTNKFKPNIALITNLNCCHLDYHKTYEDYLLSKKKLIINQTSDDHLIYNLDCMDTINLVKDSKAIKYTFSLNNNKATCYINKNKIYYKNKKIINIKKLKEQNISTLGNYLGSIIIAKILNVSNKEIKEVITKFKKYNYRFQYIKKNIINDAKSTNIYSTISAIKSIKKPIILIAGGMYRNNELNHLNDFLHKIDLVISYGETNNLLKDYFKQNNISCLKCNTLEEAVSHSKKYLNNKNILLYSPMFASYDLFKSYEERGKLFNELIMAE